MSTEGQIKEILKEHPTMSYNDIARKIGYSKGTVIYVRAGSREIFTSLVSPYICKSMRYKLFE